jgi:large subunit ribosomal protein L18
MESELKQAKIRQVRRKLIRRKSLKFAKNRRIRLSVFRSIKHISAYLIDDFNGQTIAGASSQSKEFEGKSRKDKAIALGKIIAQKAKDKTIDAVVFDRSYYKFHGIIKEFAESARTAGLNF